jgi:hypothetical protein
MKSLRSLSLIALLLAVASCKKKEPAELVAFDRVCTDPKYDAPSEKGLAGAKRMAVEGYLGPPDGLFTRCGDDCDLRLLPTREVTPGGLTVFFRVGSDDNQMEKLPNRYSAADVKLHSDDGKTLVVGSKIRVTAFKDGSIAEKTCFLSRVERVEAL